MISFTFFRRKRFKLGNTDKDTLEEELSALANLNRVMVTSQAPPPMPPVLPPPPPPPSMMPPRPFPTQQSSPGFINPPPMMPPIDVFALRNSMSTTTTMATPTSTSSASSPTPIKPKKKGGFNIDSLIDTAEETEDSDESLAKPSPFLAPPTSSASPLRAWPPIYPDFVSPPTSMGMAYPPFLPNFHLQAAANLHMAAMAALAASQHQQQSEQTTQRPFLEVRREEVASTFSQQMSPTARSDISSCSSGSSFNSLHGDLFPINLSSTPNAATATVAN